METTTINETWKRVILVPKETAYDSVFLAVAGRGDGAVALGFEMQHRLFYTLCDQAALCEGGDLLFCGREIKPETYLRQWREAFKGARPVTDSSNRDLEITSTLIVDPKKFEGGNDRYYREQLDKLRALHPFTDRDGRLEFAFHLANPVHSKLVYDMHRLHFDEDVQPFTVSPRNGELTTASQPQLWEMLA